MDGIDGCTEIPGWLGWWGGWCSEPLPPLEPNDDGEFFVVSRLLPPPIVRLLHCVKLSRLGCNFGFWL